MVRLTAPPLPATVPACPTRQSHPVLRADRRGDHQEALPGDPVHAGRDRRGGAARVRGRRRDRAHPRAQRRRLADVAQGHVRARSWTETKQRCPVLINWSTGGAGPMSERVEPPRAAAAHRRAQHGLDELREVERGEEAVRVQLRVRELVRRHHRVREGDEGARREARDGVLRRRPHQLASRARRPRPASRRRFTSRSSWACSAGSRRPRATSRSRPSRCRPARAGR